MLTESACPTPFGASPWTAESLSRLLVHLAEHGPAALRSLPADRLEAAWSATVATFLDPESEERRELEAALVASSRLSPAGLAAGLGVVLGGAVGPATHEIVSAGAARRGPASPLPASPLVVLLAANLPALAVQALLPALALGRPVLLKSASAEPFFAPAFVRALTARVPALADALAAVTWPGGAVELEAAAFAGAGKVVVYGEATTLADVGTRCPVPWVGFGPRASIAALGRGVDPAAVAAGLAEDVALFDQRGCLSIHTVYTVDEPGPLAAALATELAGLAARWPPGPATLAELAGVRQVREDAALRGLAVAELGLTAGTVVVEMEPVFQPSPGCRTVRVIGIDALAQLPHLLAGRRGQIQGVALAGEGSEDLAPELANLGASRFARPGELQHPDASWANGGLDPLDAFG